MVAIIDFITSSCERKFNVPKIESKSELTGHNWVSHTRNRKLVVLEDSRPWHRAVRKAMLFSVCRFHVRIWKVCVNQSCWASRWNQEICGRIFEMRNIRNCYLNFVAYSNLHARLCSITTVVSALKPVEAEQPQKKRFCFQTIPAFGITSSMHLKVIGFVRKRMFVNYLNLLCSFCRRWFPHLFHRRGRARNRKILERRKSAVEIEARQTY